MSSTKYLFRDFLWSVCLLTTSILLIHVCWFSEQEERRRRKKKEELSDGEDYYLYLLFSSLQFMKKEKNIQDNNHIRTAFSDRTFFCWCLEGRRDQHRLDEDRRP